MLEVNQSPEQPKFKLKYQTEIDGLNLCEGCSCPPSDSQQIARTAYRYIFETDPNQDSHKPGKIKKPKRVMKTDDENCSLCGLSCFVTKDEAIKNYLNLVKARPNLVNVLGDSLAEGNLKEDSGLQTTADSTGHFDLFEYATFDPYSTFVYIQKMEVNDGDN